MEDSRYKFGFGTNALRLYIKEQDYSNGKYNIFGIIIPIIFHILMVLSIYVLIVGLIEMEEKHQLERKVLIFVLEEQQKKKELNE